MAKRFTDTNKYKNPFIRGLQGPYKLLWDYLYHDCDHAGIWIVDFDIARIYLGDSEINKEDALEYFNEGEVRIIEVDKGEKWFILPFIEFQYGKLNPENRVHNSVISALIKYNLWDKNKGLVSPLQGAKDKDKDKDKDNKGGMGGNEDDFFPEFWDSYHSITGLKKTDMQPAQKYWKQLTKGEKEKALKNIQPYYDSLNDKKYCKKARTYLSAKSYNDEFKINNDGRSITIDLIRKVKRDLHSQ